MILPTEELTKWKTLIKVAEAYQKKRGNFASGAGMSDGRWDVNIRALDGDFNSLTELGPEAVAECDGEDGGDGERHPELGHDDHFLRHVGAIERAVQVLRAGLHRPQEHEDEQQALP